MAFYVGALCWTIGLGARIFYGQRAKASDCSNPAKMATPVIKSRAWYAFLLITALPILGWCMLSAAGKPIPFFGLELPALTNENKELSKSIKEIHATAGTVGYYLIGLHAFAGLFHHYVMRDNTLIRMLPNYKN